MPALAGTARCSRGRSDPRLAELVTALADGDQLAFREFYDRFAPQVLGLCHRVTGSRVLAEETAQEVFWEVWRSAGRRYSAERGSVLTWLMTITHHHAVDCVRRTTAARERELKASRLEHWPALPGLDEAVLAGEERRHVRQALRALTTVQCEAITLTYYQGHTVAQAAVIAGVPVPTMKTRVRDALLRLGVQMRRPCADDRRARQIPLPR